MSNNIPRGIRNNNPLNIVISNSKWIGKKLPNTDGKFEQFTDMVFGVRAALYLVRKYISQGFNSCDKIICRWSPDGNEQSYINYVCFHTGLSRHQVLSFESKSDILDLVHAMAIFECGTPISFDIFEKAYDLLTK